MQPTTTKNQGVAEQLARVPAPAAMFGHNLSSALAGNADRLATLPSIITSESGRLLAESYIRKGKAVLKVAAEKRLDITRILDAVKTAYTSAEKEQTTNLADQLAKATSTVNTYLREQLAKQRAAEAAIAEQAAKDMARKRSLESKAAVQVAADEKLAEVHEVPKAGIKLVWCFEVVEAFSVPDEFMTVNEAAIKAAIASGQRNIPGVRIYQDIARSGR